MSTYSNSPSGTLGTGTAAGRDAGSSSVSDKAGNAAGTVADAAGSAGSAVANRASETTDKAKEQAGRLQRQARTQAMQQADKRKGTLATKGRDAVTQADKVADTMRQQGMEKPAEMVKKATAEVRGYMDRLENTPTDELVREVGTMVRRAPLAFLGGAFVIGLAATRLFKAEPDHSADIQGTVPRYGTTRPAGAAPVTPRPGTSANRPGTYQTPPALTR